MKPFDPRLVRRARRAGVPLAASVAIGAAQTAAVVGQAYVLAVVVAGVVTDGDGLGDHTTGLLALALLAVARAGLTWGATVAGRAAATAVKHELRSQLLRRVTTLGPARLSDERAGGLAVLAGRGLDALDAYFSAYVPQLVLAAVAPPAIVAVTLWSDWRPALVLAVTLPLIPVFMVLVGWAANRAMERQWHALGRLAGHVGDVLAGMPTLRVFGRARRQREVVLRLAEEHRAATMATLKVAFLSSLVLELIATLGTAVIAVAVGLRLLDGDVDLRTGLFVLVLAPEAYLPLRNVGAAFHASIEGATAAASALDLLDDGAEPPATRTAAATPLPIAPFPIRLDRVTFEWPARTEPALRSVDLVLGLGERIAVVGGSGAGKSTLLALLLGFIAPDRGRVVAGGVDLASTDLEAWRQLVAWVPQRPHLFSASVAENIRLARPAASDEEVRAAAAAAGALGFVDALPDGFATRIGDGGRPLSGGERQRIALARAFLRDAPLVLLDEPTASLDAGTQAVVVDALQRLLDGRTAVVVTHRDDPLRLVDRTYHLRDGVLLAGVPA